MENILRKIMSKSSFCFDFPINILAVFFNPFYFIRKNLFQNVKLYAPELTGKILDFGCGCKPYQAMFSRQNTIYIGCDIEVSGHSHQQENIEYFYDGKTLPFADRSFTGVFSSEVFEHIFNIDEIVKELNRILVPGGKMLLTVPFVWNEHEVPFDYARYTSFGICDLLQRNGFEVIAVKKSTSYIETLFQMFCEYLRKSFSKVSTHIYLEVLFQVVVIAPVTILGIIINKLLPDDDSFFCNDIILCKKK